MKNNLTLGINGGPVPEPTKLRPDFPRVVRTFAAIKHEGGRTHTFPNTFENDNAQPTTKCDWILSGKVGIGMSTTTGGRPLPLLRQIGGSSENGTSHKNDNGKDGECGTGKYSLSGPSVTLQDSCTFVDVFSSFKEFRLQAIEIPLVSDEECEQNTAPRAFNTCQTRIFFSCARGPRCVSCILSCLSQKSVHRIHVSWHDALFTTPFSTPFPTLAPSPMTTPSLLYPSRSSTAAAPQGGFFFGRLAEQSPLTGSEPKTLIEVSSELTPIN